MDADLGKLLEDSDEYMFNPRRLDAVPVTGSLRKSSEPGKCVLLVSSNAGGDLAIEVNVDDVGFHEKAGGCGGCETDNDRITLHLRPGAVVTTNFRSTAARAVATSAFLASPIGELFTRQPQPFTRLDELLNTVAVLGWNECRANVQRDCQARFPNDPAARNQCITDGYIACGERPRLRVPERILEQLVELFREPGPGGPLPI
jgi:hypothetical protein